MKTPVHPEVQCTIWIKSEDRYTGTMSNDGGLNEAGMTLLHHWTALEDIQNLISLGAIKSIGNDIDDTDTLSKRNSGALFKDYGIGMMTTAAKSYTEGAYLYIFDTADGKWKFGKNELLLEKILK